jgi:hypothetical protein
MPSSFNHHPSSYRDPSGFVFYENGILYRQVNKIFKKDFDAFFESGFYKHLVEKKMLIPHQAIDKNLTASPDWYQTIKPEIVPFISYPYEWCFDMLKDAALLTLEAAKEAMDFGMMLKDASVYNVQWYNGKMIFIDTLSFEAYDEQKPWIAYHQFCEHFFAPLALMHYLKQPLQRLFVAYPDGVPLSVAAKMLPFKSKLNLHTNLHVHLHASMASTNSQNNKDPKPFSKQKMKNLLQSLEDGIRSFSFSSSGVWSNYYKEASTRNEYLSSKKEIIKNWISDLPIQTAFDAGANEGEFSELLQNKCNHIISADLDHSSISKLYNTCKQKSVSNILPLLIDLSNPSPALGANNQERPSFLSRIKVDIVLALALIHHLAIGKNIPFNLISEMFHHITKYLIIEFVPKEDEKIQLMLQQKKDVYYTYSEESFIRSFNSKFSIVEQHKIGDSKRTLYLMRTV